MIYQRLWETLRLMRLDMHRKHETFNRKLREDFFFSIFLVTSNMTKYQNQNKIKLKGTNNNAKELSLLLGQSHFPEQILNISATQTWMVDKFSLCVRVEHYVLIEFSYCLPSYITLLNLSHIKTLLGVQFEVCGKGKIPEISQITKRSPF